MKNNLFPLSQKYIDFINTVENVSADFLEGTTASGKTTIGAGVKFMRMVSRSRKKLHIIASKTTGTAEKNIIQQDNGILDIHPGAIYCGNGDKDYKIPHIKFEGKIIFVLGYDNRDKWELYETAVNELMKKTSTAYAPWHVLESNDKKYARIKALKIVIEEIEKVL